MRIPIRATFRRADKPGGKATLARAEYAEVPDTLIMGQMAKVGADVALHREDLDSYERIRGAARRAEDAGKIITIR